MTQQFDELQEKITDRETFLELCYELYSDLLKHHEKWENPTLERYLEAMMGWIEDMDGYYINKGMEPPKELSWKVLGDIMIAARSYE